METSTAATPAQPLATPPKTSTTQTAVDAALAGHSTTSYRDARRAERAGKPLADVPVKPAEKAAASAVGDDAVDVDDDDQVPAVAAQPERKVSKRQEQINEYERRIAAQDERIRALEAGGKPAAAAPAAEAAPAKNTNEWKRYAEMPDAPKLADFESITDHNAAMSLFIAKTMRAEDQQAGRQREHDEQRSKFLKDRSDKFGGLLKKAAEADPEFAKKIPPSVVTATPLSGCRLDPGTRALVDPRSGKPVTFSNVAAEAAFRSENPAALLTHLHANPADVQRIAALPQDEWLDALARLDGRLTPGSAAAVETDDTEPELKTISDAPDPAPVLGGRPTEPGDAETRALRDTKRGGTRAYRELRRTQRAAGMRH